MKYFSMFSGIGGFELGIQRSYEGIQNRVLSNGLCRVDSILPQQNQRPSCIGFSEIDKYAIQIYQNHFKEHKNYGNARNIVWEEVEDFDLFVGGFPCQSFSIAGKRGGFDDTRGTLFFEIARALSIKRPKLLLLENVRGLLSHDSGKTFGTILATLSDLGYFLQWQVLNSKDFGVPQNRERVFIAGHLRGERRPEVFPIRTNGKGNNEEQLSGKKTNEGKDKPNSQGRGGCTLPRIRIDNLHHHRTGEYGNGIHYNTTPTLDSGCGRDIAVNKIRRLTPTECERLQGFTNTEKYSIIKVWKQVNVNGVEYRLSTKVTDQENVVRNDVLIDCVENGVEILNQEKSFLNAKNAGKKNWYHPHIKIDDFVQLLVGINSIVEIITNNGEAVFHQNEQCLTHLKNGEKPVSKFGKEIMQLVEFAKIDLITLKELLKSTTLNHLNTGNLEQKLTILFSFVIPAIIGYIPEKTKTKDTFTIGIKTNVGYTYGVSDTSRYRCLGNAVTVNVIEAVMERLLT